MLTHRTLLLIFTLLTQTCHPLIRTKFEITTPRGAQVILLGDQHKIATPETIKQACAISKLIRKKPTTIYIEAADHEKSSFALFPKQFQEASIEAEKTIGKHTLLGNFGIIASLVPADTQVHKIDMRSIAQFIFYAASEETRSAFIQKGKDCTLNDLVFEHLINVGSLQEVALRYFDDRKNRLNQEIYDICKLQFEHCKYINIFADQSGLDVEKPLLEQLTEENKSLKKPLRHIKEELAEIAAISLYVVGSQAQDARCALTLLDATNEQTHILISGIAHNIMISNIMQKAGAIVNKSYNPHAMIMYPTIQRLLYRSGKQLIHDDRNFDDSTLITPEQINE